MNSLLRKLLYLKEKRQEAAYRALQMKQHEIRQAETILRTAESALHASTTSYGGRVDALYAPILGQTVDLRGIEEVENRIAQLDVQHERIVEAVHDAVDHLEDLKEDAQALASAYAEKTKSFDRFRALVDSMERAGRAEMERLVEIGLEEGFTNRRERFE